MTRYFFRMRPMRLIPKLALLVMAFMFVAATASASIIYTIHVTDGVETVSGTITTDGTLGLISDANITAWSLSASGLVSLSPITEAPPDGHIICGASRCGLVASLSALVVSATPNFDVNFFEGDDTVIGFRDSSVYVSLPHHVDHVLEENAPYLIGIAVPEPTTLALISAGLAGLGFSRRQQ